MASLHTGPTLANPGGPVVLQGAATVQANGPVLNVTASDNAFLSWSSFNIAAHETTRFIQPDSGSVVWNRVDDANPSEIFGRLEANGIVVLANPHGFYFGPDAFVKTGGLVVSTAPIAPPDFGGGSPWNVSVTPPLAAVVNYGHIEVGRGGSAFLIAERVENRGEIRAHEGEIGLFAGRELLLSERPDGRGLSARVRLPAGSVDNTGRLTAEAGLIALQAAVVNQGGTIEADSVREHGGVIELVASESLTLDSRSVIEARGDEAGVSDGGRITLRSEGAFLDAAGSVLSVAGGTAGGAGGEVHLSAPQMPAIHSTLEAAGRGGHSGGTLVLDPTDIVVSGSASGTTTGGAVGAGDPPETLRLGTDAAFKGFSRITLQATRDISIETAWDLDASTGVNSPGSLLTLQAGRDVRVRRNSSILADENWSVRFEAGYDFTKETVTAGIGGIYFEAGTTGGGSWLQARDGAVSLRAGKEILVNSGYVRTVGGGSIEVEALSGNVNTGSRPNGFVFSAQGIGYRVDPTGVGGVSTAAGGDVTIKAGGDVRSYLPANASSTHGDGGSGAFGAEPGNVTVQAGGNVFGHYVLRNGEGRIHAGGNAGLPSLTLALSVVRGSWAVEAENIALQEVRNPNGSFNRSGGADSLVRHAFDYDPAAGVVLKAANEVQLVGLALPRNTGEESLPSIYPPRLEIEAGAGGILFGNDVTLFPSPQGTLRLQTSDGGSLMSSTPGKTRQLIMSDSDRRQYLAADDFGPFRHDPTRLHLANTEPLRLDIGGDVRDMFLAVPTPAHWTVAGDLHNTSFLGQHLRADDVTELVVGGGIYNRSEYTFIYPEIPPVYVQDPASVTPRLIFEVLENAVGQPGLPRVSDLIPRFTFNPHTGRLGYKGRMNERDLEALLHIQVKQFLPNGAPLVDELGSFITTPATFLPESDLRALYAASQDVPAAAPEGYQLGGPGTFRLAAGSLDLGLSKGIVSLGSKYNAALAFAYDRGADLELKVNGDFAMFGSSVRNVNGGDIHIDVGGSVTVGDADLSFNPDVARGIYTVGASDVTLIAGGDIRVGGSRIATYDDGDVFVRSEHGNLDAGVGGLGYVRVERIAIHPQTREREFSTRAIPGSGILATSFPGSSGGLGDITIETPEGDIIANEGGIMQLALNGRETVDARIALRAGTRLLDADGQPVLDAQGKPVVLHEGSISAGASGVIGANVSLEATRDISGVVVAQRDIDVSSVQNITVTAVASGSVSVSAGGSVTGTIVALGGISASADTVSASLISDSVQASGTVTSAVGFSEASVSAASAQRMDAEETVGEKEASAVKADEEDDKPRRPVLARTVSRVTVLLPGQVAPK